MFIAALLDYVGENNSNAHQWMNGSTNMASPDTGILFSHQKARNPTWMSLGNITLSERSQADHILDDPTHMKYPE